MFQSHCTYKELKLPGNSLNSRIWNWVSHCTYKELKRVIPIWFHFKPSCLIAPIRNWNLCLQSSLLYSRSSHCTYKELKLTLCNHNGRQRPASHCTYKELKLSWQGTEWLLLISLIAPIRNWNILWTPETRNNIESHCTYKELKRFPSLLYRQHSAMSHCTYKELKPAYPRITGDCLSPSHCTYKELKPMIIFFIFYGSLKSHCTYKELKPWCYRTTRRSFRGVSLHL